MRIGVDLTGSDSSAEELLEGAFLAQKKLKSTLFFYSRENIPLPQSSKLELVSEEITMEDAPLHAIRLKKDSSIVKGLHDLSEKKIDAFISAGNTGALLAGAALFLPPLPHIDRPALLATMPTAQKPMVVIDVGGNINSSPDQLIQFAHMGVAYQSHMNGVEKPRVGLLNIGIESMKGTKSLKEVYKSLFNGNQTTMNFVGNCEGRDVFQGNIDVLVTDGFAGNIFLKTSEGVSKFIQSKLSHFPEVEKELEQFNYEEHPGALLCGVDGLVIKCHGASPSKVLFHTLIETERLIEKELLQKFFNSDFSRSLQKRG